MDWEKHLSTILHHTNLNLEKQFSADPLVRKKQQTQPVEKTVEVSSSSSDNNLNGQIKQVWDRLHNEMEARETMIDKQVGSALKSCMGNQEDVDSLRVELTGNSRSLRNIEAGQSQLQQKYSSQAEAVSLLQSYYGKEEAARMRHESQMMELSQTIAALREQQNSVQLAMQDKASRGEMHSFFSSSAEPIKSQLCSSVQQHYATNSTTTNSIELDSLKTKFEKLQLQTQPQVLTSSTSNKALSTANNIPDFETLEERMRKLEEQSVDYEESLLEVAEKIKEERNQQFRDLESENATLNDTVKTLYQSVEELKAVVQQQKQESQMLLHNFEVETKLRAASFKTVREDATREVAERQSVVQALADAVKRLETSFGTSLSAMDLEPITTEQKRITKSLEGFESDVQSQLKAVEKSFSDKLRDGQVETIAECKKQNDKYEALVKKHSDDIQSLQRKNVDQISLRSDSKTVRRHSVSSKQMMKLSRAGFDEEQVVKKSSLINNSPAAIKTKEAPSDMKFVKCEYCNENIEEGRIELHSRLCDKKLATCPYCKQEILLNKMGSHQESCESRTERCKHCDQMIFYKDFSEHVANCDQQFKQCPHCLRRIKLADLEAHMETCDCRLTDCPTGCGAKFLKRSLEQHLKGCKHHKKEVECQYCDEAFAESEIKDHQKVCDWVPSRCSKCNMVIIARDLERHEKGCKKQSPCAHCNDTSFQDLKMHVQNCPKRPIKCVRCNNSFAADSIVAHSSSCVQKSDRDAIPKPPPPIERISDPKPPTVQSTTELSDQSSSASEVEEEYTEDEEELSSDDDNESNEALTLAEVVQEWEVENVRDWLKEDVGVGPATEMLFLRHKVDGKKLLQVNEDYLIETMNLKDELQRNKILGAIEAIRDGDDGEDSESFEYYDDDGKDSDNDDIL